MRPSLPVSAAALLLSLCCAASSETFPIAEGYRMPTIFALNDGKPFYLDKDPVTGTVDFTAGGKDAIEPTAEESSSVANVATAATDDDEEDEEGEGTGAAGDGGGATAPRPLQAAPVVEEVDEDDEPPPQPHPSAAPIPKEQIDRKDTAAASKTSGGRPNDINEGGDGNPFFHQFLNLNVHEYGDRIPGAPSIRDDPYSFGSLGVGSSPLEREHKFPLISSSYANTKVQGVGGNYYYGDKGTEKEKFKPGYTGPHTQSGTRRPAPSYYQEKGQDEEDDYYGRPSTSSTSSDDEEEDDHKYSAEGSSHYHGDHDDANDEEEGEEEGESVDELVEEVSDHDRPPIPPKRPLSPSRQPLKKPSTHQHHAEESEEEESPDYNEERPLNYGGGGFAGRPSADNPPQQTYYYERPSDGEEDEEHQDGPQRKPATFQGGHRGEEDRPRPTQAEEEVDEEEDEEEGESSIEERPPPPKPSGSYLGFGVDYDRENHGNFGEKVQGSQKVQRPKDRPGYKYGYSGPPPEFNFDGFFSSDNEGPRKKPTREPESDAVADDEKPQPSEQNEGLEKEIVIDEKERRPYDTRRPYDPPQVVRFTSQPPTERPLPTYSQPSPSTTTPTRETFQKPTNPSPYGIEEPFRPIYGPGEGDGETFLRPVHTYQQANKNQQIPSPVRPSASANSPFQSTSRPDPRPSGGQQFDSYFPLRPITVNELPQKKKETIPPETIQKEPIASTYKPQYEVKTKKPIEQGLSSWKIDVSDNAGGPLLRPTQEILKEAQIHKDHPRPTQTSNSETVTKYPSTLPPPPHREVVGIGSVGEPEFVKPIQQTAYGPFRFPDHEYVPQRPPIQQTGPLFVPRPSANNGVTVNPNLPPPPFGLPPQNGQRPVLPPSPSPNLRPQLLDNSPLFHTQRPQVMGGGPPPPPPRRWEDRPINPHSNARPPSQNFLHRPRPQEQQNGPQQTGGHPYKFVSRKPGPEPVLLGSASNAVYGNSKKIVPPNGPKAQAPDPNLPNILPQFRPNAKISYSTIHREKGPYSPPPPPPFGPIQRVSNVPERPIRPVPSFYEHLQPPPPPNNLRIHRIQGAVDEIPYGPPQAYPFGPGGSPPVGRRSGQHHQARFGEDSADSVSENQGETRRRPQVTTLQMMRTGLMEHQAARHPIVSREDVDRKSTANLPPPAIHVNPTIYVTPDEGSTGASLSVDSSASEDHPVFVVYPVSDSSHRDDGVVVGTRGSQRPLPPSSIAAETELSVLPPRPNSVLSDFPYPLLKPSSTIPTKPTKPESAIVGPVYSLVQQEEGPNDNRKDNSDSNIIPNLQDYSPYATKKPTVPQDGGVLSTTTEANSTTMPPSPTTTSTPGKTTAKVPLEIVNAWQPDSEIEVLATMHTESSGVPVNHRPLVEDKTETSSPPPLNFQAPFHASANIVPSPDSGWSAVGGSTSTAITPAEVSSSISRSEPASFDVTLDVKDNDSDNGDTSKFDFDNFKPQLFGGFKPIYSLPGDEDEEFKHALGTTERQER